MTLSSRIKAFFSRSPSSKSSRSDSPSSPSPVEPSFRSLLRKRKRTSTVSSSYAQGISGLDHPLDWMMHVSPTATLTESDTTNLPPVAYHSTSPIGLSAEGSRKKKKRPVSMFASLGPIMSSAGYPAADSGVQPTFTYNKRSSMPAPFVFAPVPRIPGVRGLLTKAFHGLIIISAVATCLFHGFWIVSFLLISIASEAKLDCGRW